MKEDRISTLPSNVLETILMRLPIKEAGRTSILSRRWRYEWSSIPNLVFIQDEIGPFLYHKLPLIINQVLLLHHGPIEMFSYEGCCTDIEQWLLVLLRNGIKDLNLKFHQYSEYRLPSTLFRCQKLVNLKLENVEVMLPQPFNGFATLMDLYLHNIIITDDELACLISKCPLLRKLVFFNFNTSHRIKVNAPNLRKLKVGGPIQDLYLENTPLLASLSVALEEYEEDEHQSPDRFIRSLWGLLRIEKLEFGYNMIDFVANGNIFGGFPTYNYLKKIFLTCLNFLDANHVFILCSFLRSAPVLQKLEIEAEFIDPMTVLPDSSLCQGKEWSDIRLDHLKTFTIMDIEDVRLELEFIEFVLANAPILEELIIGLTDSTPDQKIYAKITKFRRASARVQIF